MIKNFVWFIAMVNEKFEAKRKEEKSCNILN